MNLDSSSGVCTTHSRVMLGLVALAATEENIMNPETTAVEQILIVGAGLAGINAAEELRTHGYDNAITVLSGEPHLPYDRPPLSKDVMLGHKTLDDIELHPHQWYADNDVSLLSDHQVTKLDLAEVVFSNRQQANLSRARTEFGYWPVLKFAKEPAGPA